VVSTGPAVAGGSVEVESRCPSPEVCVAGTYTGSDGRNYRFLGCDSVIVDSLF
jgi:hypothetical protein